MDMDNEEYESVSLIETPMDLSGRELVCYPYLIVLCKVSMPRMFMKPRIAWTVITVDLVKGVPLRSNMFPGTVEDRKSTRLNSSHVAISYAVFCLKKKIR